MRNNGRNTVKTRPATRNTYSSRNSSSTRYGRNTYSSSRNYGSRNYSNYGMNNAERGYYSSNRYNYTSEALDYATDARLRKAIQDMKRKPTVFIVSQRTSSIQNADMILVLDDGKSVGVGTHDELLTTCSVYKEIYDSQYKKTDSKKSGKEA